MKDFLKSIFWDTYDVEPEQFLEAQKTLRAPYMIFFQIITFWFFYYELPVEEHGMLSGFDKALNAVLYGFGGILVYYIFSFIMALVAYLFTDKLPSKLIIIVLGIIGTYFAFKIL